ncbi:zinc finger protein 143-like [Zophobas morio]
MDNADEEPTFQYYTIKSEEDNFVGISDILNLPSLPEDNSLNNKQIFYLTFDSNEDVKEEETQPVEDISVENTLSESAVSYNEADLKLITLDDGRIFMTTDKNLGNLGAPSVLFEPSEIQESVDEGSQMSNEEESVDNTDVNFQLLELDDGSQAIITLYKIKNDPPKEDPPKKVKRFQCTYEGCNKVYATSYHLTVHMRSHTDSKPYQCDIDGCEKRFSTNYSLKAHIRTHTGEKPYCCTLCTKQFKTSGDLQKHFRIHTGEKPFECPVEGCGRSFTTSNIRKVHIRSHTGERPYSCNYPNCGKAFTSSTNYKNHLRIHSGEKPYVCSVEGCGKRFTEYSSLYKHNAVHQPVRPHECIFCGQRFKQESALNFHKRLKHNVVVTKDGTEIIVKIE